MRFGDATIGRIGAVDWQVRVLCAFPSAGLPRRAVDPEMNHTMESDKNPYFPPAGGALSARARAGAPKRRGPLLDFALTGIVSSVLAMPLLVPKSIAAKADPDPLGYLLVLLSFPVGGLVFRYRSRGWPIDETVRLRQSKACMATLLLPITVAFLAGTRGQGLHMIVCSGVVSLFLMAGIQLSGRRRLRNVATGEAD